MNRPSPDYSPTVFVVDDDPGVRESIAFLIGTTTFTCACFATGSAFLSAYRTEMPGCLIADIRMPGMSGLELQEQLRSTGIVLPIIFLTGHGSVPDAVKALKSGAVDFLQKPFQSEALLALVTSAIEKDADHRRQTAQSASMMERLGTLTPREAEILILVRSGKASKVIALDLGISERTVELHRSRVMKKLGARSFADLLTVLQDNGV